MTFAQFIILGVDFEGGYNYYLSPCGVLNCSFAINRRSNRGICFDLQVISHITYFGSLFQRFYNWCSRSLLVPTELPML